MASEKPTKKVIETPKELHAEPGATNQSFQCDVAFPTYCAGFFNDRTVVLGGGGGSSKTGVKNRLVSPSRWARDREIRRRERVARWSAGTTGSSY